MRWASQLLKDFRRMTRITWASDEVRLVPSFRVHPTSFRLERQYFIGDEHDRTMTALCALRRTSPALRQPEGVAAELPETTGSAKGQTCKNKILS